MDTKPSYEELKQRVAELEKINVKLLEEKESSGNKEQTLVYDILESISDGFFALDNDLVVSYFNSSAEELLGRKKDDVLGRRLFDAFPEAKGSIFEVEYAKAIKNKQFQCFETYFELKPYRNWYEVRVYPYRDGISVYFQVTTERKLAEIALREAHDNLEKQVAERTSELSKANEELRVEIQERNKIQQELELSRQRYHGLFTHMTSGVAIYRPENNGEDFTIIDLNRTAENISDVDKESVIGRSILEIFPAVKELGLFEVFQNVFRSGVPQQHPISRYKDERIEYWVESIVYKIPTGEIIAIYTDKSKEKQADEDLRESEQRFREMAENIGEVLWYFDLIDNRVVYVSPAYENIWGRPVESLYNRYEDWAESIFPDDLEYAQESFQEILQTGASNVREYRIVRPDGGVRWVSDRGFAIRNQEGKIYRIAGIAEDITQRKQLEKEIVSHSRFLKVTIDSLPYPFYVVDSNTYEILDANIHLGPEEYWKGKTCYSLTHKEKNPCNSPDHSCPLAEVKRTGKPLVLEHVHFDENNNEINVEVHGYPIFDDQGKVVKMIEYSIDISARKKAEKEKEKLIKELQEALNEIKILKGIIPICMHCKGIRDDKGYWNQLEKYISEHSDVQFSHGICDECLKKYYPEQAD